MSIPAERLAANIERSVFRHLRDAFVIPNGLEDSVSFNDSQFTGAGKARWVGFQFVSSEAGRKGSSLLQADVVTRVGGKAADGFDRFGYDAKELADVLYDAMHVDTIQLYDFADPASPVPLTSRTIMVQTSGGIFREPEETRAWEPEDGLARVTMTWRLRLPGDAADKHSYRT